MTVLPGSDDEPVPLVFLDRLAPRLSAMPGTGYGLGAALGPRSGLMPVTGEGEMVPERRGEVTAEDEGEPSAPTEGRWVKRNEAAREKDAERDTVVLERLLALPGGAWAAASVPVTGGEGADEDGVGEGPAGLAGCCGGCIAGRGVLLAVLVDRAR